MGNLDRVTFAFGHVSGHSVAIFERDAWHSIILADGEPTLLTEIPSPLGAVTSRVTVVAAAGSGIINSSPGIDIVRYDAKDAPYVYNIDHYTVIENLSMHPQYHRVLSVAGVQDEDVIRSALQDYVFIVGPEKLDHHWVEKIPEQIKNARAK